MAHLPDPAWGRPGGPGSTPHGPWTCWASWGTMLDKFRRSWGRTPHPHVDLVLEGLATEPSAAQQPPGAKSENSLGNADFAPGGCWAADGSVASPWRTTSTCGCGARPQDHRNLSSIVPHDAQQVQGPCGVDPGPHGRPQAGSGGWAKKWPKKQGYRPFKIKQAYMINKTKTILYSRFDLSSG